MPAALRPWHCDDLVRLGSDGDGGYLVRETDIASAEVLVGMGIADDWTFERDFLLRRDVPLLAYDASVGPQMFALGVLDGLIQPHRPRVLWRAIQNIFNYPRFFSGKRRHVRKHVGPGHPARHARFAEVKRAIGERQVFLKIDIEGGEYRILKDLIGLAAQTCGLVIEFHDCDLHRARILDFVATYPLSLVHLHINNFGPLDEDGFPFVLELTFSAAPSGDVPASPLPHPLDRPNRAGKPEYRIAFTG